MTRHPASEVAGHEPLQNTGMLSGYRVLDLTNEVGLFCGALLGSLGCEVICVEPPEGNRARQMGPFREGEDGAKASMFWEAYAVNRRSICLDLTSEAGRTAFLDLVAGADVVLESFDVGYMAELGLDFESLKSVKPDIILTSISPYGQTGPASRDRASDLTSLASGGALFAAGSEGGRPPVLVSHIPQAYLQGATDAAWATVLAIFARGWQSGGQHVDVSLQAAVERCVLHSQIAAQITGKPFESLGDVHTVIPRSPYQIPEIWQTKDGFISFGVYLAEQGQRRNPRLINWMAEEGYADDFLVNYPWANYNEWHEISAEDRQRVRESIEKFFLSKTRAELAEQSMERNVMIQLESTFSDVLKHPQLNARSFFQAIERDGEEWVYPGGFCLPSATSCLQRSAAPALGADTDMILGAR